MSSFVVRIQDGTIGIVLHCYLHAYPLNDFGKPFRAIQAGRRIGGIVVTVEPDVSVPAMPAFLLSYKTVLEAERLYPDHWNHCLAKL